jgi:hypothetical protein
MRYNSIQITGLNKIIFDIIKKLQVDSRRVVSAKNDPNNPLALK